MKMTWDGAREPVQGISLPLWDKAHELERGPKAIGENWPGSLGIVANFGTEENRVNQKESTKEREGYTTPEEFERRRVVAFWGSFPLKSPMTWPGRSSLK